MKFLLVEDNLELAKAISNRLQVDGHVVDHVGKISEAIDYFASYEYDLVLLDVMLPDGDGRTFLKHQRTQNDGTPVIVLTARSQVSDRISMLDLGADDYVTKPFDHAELEARCRAVLRRKSNDRQTTKQFGNVEFNSIEGRLSVGGKTVNLRNRELRLLEVFLNAPGQIFSKQKLVDRLFSYDEDVSENAVEVYVGRLRKHLSGSPLMITTLRGLGYRLDYG